MLWRLCSFHKHKTFSKKFQKNTLVFSYAENNHRCKDNTVTQLSWKPHKNKNLKVIDLIEQSIDELKLCKDVPGGYKEIYYAGNITKDWDKFIDSLPEADKSDPGKLFIYNFEKPSKESSSTPPPTPAQIKKANEKNYKVYRDRNFAEEYVVE